MKLRKLELKDAPLMFEWMHDESVVKDLRTNFMEKSLEDCIVFIKNSWDDKSNWNVAIADEEDNYVGTVSLKNIKESSAEFGITVRSCAMGKGIAIAAMKEILRYAFEEMKISMVYWCVSPINKRAVRFYDKHEYKRIDVEKINDFIQGYTNEQIDSYIWYVCFSDSEMGF